MVLLGAQARVPHSKSLIQKSKVSYLSTVCLEMAALVGSIAPVACLPVRRTARAPSRVIAPRASTSTNEAVEVKTKIEPTVFYAGKSYTESEVMPRF